MNEDKENEVNNVESEVNQATNTAPANDKKGFSIAALVLGIIALVLCCIWYVSIPCGIIALILGIIGLKSSKRGMSIAGIITGVIGMILSIVLVIAIVMLGVSIFNSAKDAIEDSDYPSSYYYYND
ncbi:MAG: DUF4190 domain-containing protein [Clostridia bacterium]|jgi:hypothetical protein